MKEFITYSIVLFGIKAPWFSWAAAVVLIYWPAKEIYKLIKLSRRQEKTFKKLTSDILEIQTKYPLQGSRGLSSLAIDHLHQLIISIPSLVGTWNVFRSKLIYRRLPDDDDAEQVWQTDSAGNIITEDVFLGDDFDKRQFHSVPGIVTGFGLLMTFVAILVGLWDVKIINNKVNGLENLIGGLSGKFISSVAALFAATVFLILEKQFFHRLNRVRHSLVNTIDSLVPCRSESHILEEISQNIAEQTNAFRMFNADLAHKLRNSFSESMGPTLERMVLAIDGLNQLTNSSKAELLDTLREMNQLLKHSEETRQDSISGQVESLLKDLKQSLAESIDRMSKEFNKSLTGSTQDQFSRVAETVGATAEVLEGMNRQFNDTQVALQELIHLAKQSTESQFTSGSALIEQMVSVLGGTLVQMEEKITDLSGKMTNTIEDTAERSAEAAGGIISEVRALNEQTVQKFVEMLQKHEQQLDRVDLLKQALQDSVREFAEYVTGYNTINSDLKNVTKDTNSALQLLAHSSQDLKKSQESFNEIAELAMNKIQFLAESNGEQKELWDDINSSMNQYKNTFAVIETSAATILTQISNHLQNFSKATHDHFNQTVTVANDHINTAVGQLSTSIESLGDRLEDLNDIVDNMPRKH